MLILAFNKSLSSSPKTVERLISESIICVLTLYIKGDRLGELKMAYKDCPAPYSIAIS